MTWWPYVAMIAGLISLFCGALNARPDWPMLRVGLVLGGCVVAIGVPLAVWA